MGKHSDIGISELLLLVREGDELAFSELVERYTPMLNKVISLFTAPSSNPARRIPRRTRHSTVPPRRTISPRSMR